MHAVHMLFLGMWYALNKLFCFLSLGWIFFATILYILFSPPAIERLSSGLFQEVIITNTIPLKEGKTFPQLTILSVANLLGETIWRVHDDCSVSFDF
jgi:ribose-phosphate pyrophosphokinase